MVEIPSKIPGSDIVIRGSLPKSYGLLYGEIIPRSCPSKNFTRIRRQFLELISKISKIAKFLNVKNSFENSCIRIVIRITTRI